MSPCLAEGLLVTVTKILFSWGENMLLRKRGFLGTWCACLMVKRELDVALHTSTFSTAVGVPQSHSPTVSPLTRRESEVLLEFTR